MLVKHPPTVLSTKGDTIFDGHALPRASLPQETFGFMILDHRQAKAENGLLNSSEQQENKTVAESTASEKQGKGFVSIAPGQQVNGIRLTVKEIAESLENRRFEVQVEDVTGRDRALTLFYALPLPAGELFFERDPRTSERLLPTTRPASDTHSMGCGAGGLNRWPFGAVTVNGKGYALGIDTAHPAYFRTVVHPQLRLLVIAFDLGLVPEKRTASFAFRAFNFTGGFRGALARYAELEPSAFKARVPEHGIWMPFAPIKNVQGWEDFGFKFKEGHGDVAWDDTHNIYTFRYVEPSTWWMKMDQAHGTKPFSMADCTVRAQELVRANNMSARVWQNYAMRNAAGQRVGRVMDTPWCRGAVWLLSPLPGLAAPCEYWTKNPEKEFATYDQQAFPAGRDGEYIDSAEGYLTPALDFNRRAFSASATPLCFSSDAAHRPALFKGLSMYEFVRQTAQRVWPRGRFVMANCVPGRWPWLPAYVDVGGTEAQWIDRNGKWRPESHASLIYKRAMCMGKPYCYLLNVDFTKLKYADMENFMGHCVAYGLFPGCFSHNASEGHYFTRPEIYNRDRPLFKKYVPLCKKLSEAGWRPVNTLVTADDSRVFVEQFGDHFVTVFNSARETVTVRLATCQKGMVAELVEGRKMAFINGQHEVILKPDAVLVLDFCTQHN